MANKNDALKKHHFWILAGVAPLLVLLAIVFLITGVSGAIDTENANITKTENEVKSPNAPGTGAIAALDKKKDTLGDIRGQLWKMNWDKQSPFFTWPETPNKTFDGYNTMKFGTTFRDFIANEKLREDFKPAYATTYEKLGESIAPTTFRGGWQTVLRWVRDWGTLSPESKQLWLVMEDVWIQRAMLKPIAQVNEDIARFTLVRPDGQVPPPKKRTFVSHVWQLDLEVAARKPGQGTGQILKARLKNRTNQLQVLGVGSAMILKVWFDPKLDLPPFEFRVEGSGAPGGESIPATDPARRAAGESDSLEIPITPGTDVVEIAKVVQVLDKRTVPVRRLERLALGYPSAKDFSKPLNEPPFFPAAPLADPNAPLGSGAPISLPMSSPETGGGPGGGGFGSGATGAGVGPGAAGGMRLTGVADGNRKRYVEINQQLRRVPVAMTLIVDQMYMNEVLIAYANSPLRFETVQYSWQRFTESLDQPAAGGAYPGGSAPMGYGSSSGDTGETGTATSFTGAGLSSGGPPGISLMPPGGYGSGQFGGIPGLGADTLSSVSEAQANSGLIQLTVYGIVTLYERYDPPKKEGTETPAGEAAKTPAEAAKTDVAPSKPDDAAKPMTPTTGTVPMNPMIPTPTPMTPAPTTPMTPAPASPPMTPVPTTPAPATPPPATPAPTPPK
ncbi:hypothetical protein [Limnoglobus roseus]|uniref:Uncharacterized protein n=1 Tax=Limnoglobus roseus TaxID=2598579 RepID=A0A5C1AFY6_9BACT|nr:hypothetical protein [Limnoglobus roseus]QEL16896.1 hypothetical protein PX52LOC_03871 [Limnoglobus roseus]